MNWVWRILFLKTDYDWLTSLLGYARGDFEYFLAVITKNKNMIFLYL